MFLFKTMVTVAVLMHISYIKEERKVFAEDTISITTDTTGWISSDEVKDSTPVVATNYITINNQKYKVETSMLMEEDCISLNEYNRITNMDTKEIISYTSQNKEQETSKLLYAMNGSTTYNDVLCDENTKVYYKIEPNGVGETLKKMYLHTKIGADIIVSIHVGMDGTMTHTIEVSNTSNTVLKDVSLLAMVDIQINGSEAITAYANGSNGMYMLSGHVNLFGDPVKGISKMYIGENGIVEEQELDTNAFSALEAEIGSKSPEMQNPSIYYKGMKQNIEKGEVVSYAYQETIYTGELQNNILVEYVDKDGKNLTDLKILKGKYGESYNTHQLVFEGYKLIKKEGKTEGFFTNIQQRVTYQYQELTDTIDTSKDPLTILYIGIGSLLLCVLYYIKKRNTNNGKYQ